jgi:hypothetical protein
MAAALLFLFFFSCVFSTRFDHVTNAALIQFSLPKEVQDAPDVQQSGETLNKNKALEKKENPGSSVSGTVATVAPSNSVGTDATKGTSVSSETEASKKGEVSDVSPKQASDDGLPRSHIELLKSVERRVALSLRNSSTSLEDVAKKVLLGSSDASAALKKELATLDGVDNTRWIRPKMRATIAKHQKKCGNGGKCAIGTGLRRYVGLDSRRLSNETLAFPATSEHLLDAAAKSVQDRLENIRVRLATTTAPTWPTSMMTTTAPSELIQLSDDDIVQSVLKRHALGLKNEHHPQSIAKLRQEAIQQAALKAAAEAARQFDLKH